MYAIDIPPVGGDTLFADQSLALSEMPQGLLQKIQGRLAVHSARMAYAPDGMYGATADVGSDIHMKILTCQSAFETQHHPLIMYHSETGIPTLFGCLGYILWE